MEEAGEVIIISAKYFICTMLLFASGFCYADELTPMCVKAFYAGMQTLSEAKDDQAAWDISKSMKECFYGDLATNPSGLDIPNDFRFFNYDKKNISHEDGSLTTSNYINRLTTYIYNEKVLKVEYRILKSVLDGAEPDFSNHGLSNKNTLVTTYITKTFTLNGERKTFNDTVTTTLGTGLQKNKICEIRNGFGSFGASIETLRIQARRAYYAGRYQEAYKCYQQIIELNEKDADALYRIGLMTYYRQGCSYSKKEAHKKGRNYLERVEKIPYDPNIKELREKASNVLVYWKYTL